MNTTTITIRRTAALAAILLGMQVTAACGTQESGPGTVGTTVKVQDGVGSADAANHGNPRGSADALERRLAAERSGACLISAEAAERLGDTPCVD